LGRKWTLAEINKINEIKQFNLRKIIEVLEELVLANSGADSFTEIFKIIYAKLYDEWEADNRPEKSLLFRQYKSSETTKKEISKLFEDAKKEWKGIFSTSDKIELTPEHLNVCVGELTEVKLFFSNLRIIDEAFEYLIPDVAKSKKGQYFTPRPIIDFCVRMLNPSNKEYVIDPACGSAGFLVHTMEYVWTKYEMTSEKTKTNYASKYLWGIDFDEKSAKISRAIMLIAGDGKTHIFKQNSLEHPKWTPEITVELKKEELVNDDKNKHLGFDIVMSNPPFAGDIQEKSLINLYNTILGYRYSYKIDVGKIKSMIKSITEEFQVTFTDEGKENILSKVKEINKDDELDLEQEDDRHFACQLIAQVMIDSILDGELFEPQLTPRLKEIINFKKNESKWDKVDRHILFIERIIDLLKPNGRAVIVLPQGIFSNTNEKYVRKYVTSKARILAVVGLHGNSFKPHTGTKTSLLFLRKYEEGESLEDYPIFFATSKLSFKNNSGEYIFLKDSQGNLVLDETKNPVYQTDLFMIAEAFIEFAKKEGLNFFNLGSSVIPFNAVKYEQLMGELEVSEISFNKLVNKNEAFRLDSDYFKKEYLTTEILLENQKHFFLEDRIHNVKSFGAYSLYNNVNYADEGIPFLRCVNIKNSKVTFSDVFYINEEAHKVLWKSEVKPKMVLLTMSGSAGSVAIAEEDWNYPINSNQDIAKITCADKINPYYLYLFLISKYGSSQIKRQLVGSVQQHILLWQIKRLVIPEFSNTFQKHIEKIIRLLNKIDNDAKLFYQQAEDLLLSELGLKDWQPTEETVAVKSFTKSFLLSGRLDAEYYQPKYDQLIKRLREKIELIPLRDLLTFNQRGKQPIYIDNEDEYSLGLPVINSKHVREGEVLFTDNRYAYILGQTIKRNDVLINGTGKGTIGRSAPYLYSDEAIPDNHVTILRTNSLDPAYLSLYLNSIVGKLEVEKYFKGSSGQIELYPDEINQFLTWNAPDNFQKQIRNKIDESQQKKKQSQQLLEIAKTAVEKAIETDETTATDWINQQFQSLDIDIQKLDDFRISN
jgi:type I restriction-modification system DNA methylase subunit